MYFIKIYIKQTYINCYDTSIQMCGQYCILAPPFACIKWFYPSRCHFVLLFHFDQPTLIPLT